MFCFLFGEWIVPCWLFQDGWKPTSTIDLTSIFHQVIKPSTSTSGVELPCSGFIGFSWSLLLGSPTFKSHPQIHGEYLFFGYNFITLAPFIAPPRLLICGEHCSHLVCFTCGNKLPVFFHGRLSGKPELDPVWLQGLRFPKGLLSVLKSDSEEMNFRFMLACWFVKKTCFVNNLQNPEKPWPTVIWFGWVR